MLAFLAELLPMLLIASLQRNLDLFPRSVTKPFYLYFTFYFQGACSINQVLPGDIAAINRHEIQSYIIFYLLVLFKNVRLSPLYLLMDAHRFTPRVFICQEQVSCRQKAPSGQEDLLTNFRICCCRSSSARYLPASIFQQVSSPIK